MWRLFQCIIVMALLVSCSAPSESPAAREAVTITGYELSHVQLSSSRQARGVDGKIRNWKSAYIVRLNTTMPEQEGLHPNFYIGDWRVPEYGGWKGGVYFYIYDPKRLEMLDGKSFAYTAGAQSRKETRIIFTVQPRASMSEIKESDIYPNRTVK